MADTPADQPKRRRAAKSSGDTPSSTSRPRGRAKKADTPASAAAEKKPAASKRTRKADAAQAEAPASKPRAPREPEAAVPVPAASAPSPSPAPTSAPAAAEAKTGSRLGWLTALGAAAAVGGAWFVWRASRAEEPDYQLVEQDGAVEVRKYPSLVTAGTHTRGERQAAINEGFRTLADYLFAKSRPGPKLEMTAPVLADAADGGWRVRFVMPAGKARGQLPAAPDGVELTGEPAGRFAAIRFSGRATDALLETKEQELRSWLQTKSFPHQGRAVHAFYNAPFLPGPMRRNEVLIMLSSEGGTGG